MKTLAASSNLPIKLICCYKPYFVKSCCLLKSIAINL